MWYSESSVSCSMKDSVTVHVKEDDCLSKSTCQLPGLETRLDVSVFLTIVPVTYDMQLYLMKVIYVN